MKMIVMLSMIVVTVADMVPHAGPYLALAASAMAAWGFAASPKLAVGTIGYGIMMTVVYSPGFILTDLTGGGAQYADLPAGVGGIADSVGALATGTMPDIAGSNGLGLTEVTQLSAVATFLLVLCHIAAMVIGVRRKLVAGAAGATGAAEAPDYEYE